MSGGVKCECLLLEADPIHGATGFEAEPPTSAGLAGEAGNTPAGAALSNWEASPGVVDELEVVVPGLFLLLLLVAVVVVDVEDLEEGSNGFVVAGPSGERAGARGGVCPAP